MFHLLQRGYTNKKISIATHKRWCRTCAWVFCGDWYTYIFLWLIFWKKNSVILSINNKSHIRSFLKINSRNTIEDHGGGRNTLHGVITELTTAPLKITYAGWELFGTSCPELRFRCHQTMNWRISSRTAIRAFATATTSLRMMINRLIIRFS